MAFSDILKVIEGNKTFIVTSHIMPDGDSVGSVLAMTSFLTKMGKITFPIINDILPKKYLFLPGSKDISRPSEVFCDVVMCLDSGDEARLGFEKDLRKYGRTIVNIDHHKTNDRFGDINYVDALASSTGEIVYQLIRAKSVVDIDMALSLYTAIITDTGSIKYSNTSAETLRILADLVEIGVKPDVISREVFENRSVESLKLQRLYLDSVEFFEEYKIALSYLKRSMLDEAGACDDDVEGLINLTREVEGVEVAVFLREKEPDVVKVGLRSNGSVDVSRIAEDFKGGGHAKAAGCTLNMPLDKARELLLDSVRGYIERDAIGRHN